MATQKAILDHLNESIDKFMRKVPAVQKKILSALLEDLRDIDTDARGRLKTTVKNLSKVSRIKDRLANIILDPEYKALVKEFAGSFETLTQLQNQYWTSIEKGFKPNSLMKAIQKLAVEDVVSKLTEAGIGANIEDKLIDILRTNITSGGSYSELTIQLQESLTDTPKGEGSLTKYASQIVTDALNQYNAQYTQLIAADLGYEWFAYTNTDIKTTRPFCDAMTDRRYFHISEVEDLINGRVELTYLNRKTRQREQVPINSRTGLPSGMIPETNASNFFIRRGGYRCRHQIRPISEKLVPDDVKRRIFASFAYIRWKAGSGQ